MLGNCTGTRELIPLYFLSSDRDENTRTGIFYNTEFSLKKIQLKVGSSRVGRDVITPEPGSGIRSKVTCSVPQHVRASRNDFVKVRGRKLHTLMNGINRALSDSSGCHSTLWSFTIMVRCYSDTFFRVAINFHARWHYRVD